VSEPFRHPQIAPLRLARVAATNHAKPPSRLTHRLKTYAQLEKNPPRWQTALACSPATFLL